MSFRNRNLKSIANRLAVIEEIKTKEANKQPKNKKHIQPPHVGKKKKK